MNVFNYRPTLQKLRCKFNTSGVVRARGPHQVGVNLITSRRGDLVLYLTLFRVKVTSIGVTTISGVKVTPTGLETNTNLARFSHNIVGVKSNTGGFFFFFFFSVLQCLFTSSAKTAPQITSRTRNFPMLKPSIGLFDIIPNIYFTSFVCFSKSAISTRFDDVPQKMCVLFQSDVAMTKFWKRDCYRFTGKCFRSHPGNIKCSRK